MHEFEFAGYKQGEWIALKETLSKRNLLVSHLEMIDTYLSAGIASFTKQRDMNALVDERISAAVEKGIKAADVKCLAALADLRDENARLQHCVDAMREALQEFDESGNPF